MISNILYYLPLAVAFVILIIFSMISAYVFKFRLERGGLGFDYIIFSLLIIFSLYIGGVI